LMEARTADPAILLTGFEAFGDSEKNPTAEIVRLLDGTSIADHRVSGIALPVTAAGAPAALEEAVALRGPSLVVSLGLAGGRDMLALERVAINVLDFPIPDNDGLQPSDEPVVEDGPAAYFATLPIKAILAAWRDVGLPGYVSNTPERTCATRPSTIRCTSPNDTAIGQGWFTSPTCPSRLQASRGVRRAWPST
jgi:pyroglutamyl-peptidase